MSKRTHWFWFAVSAAATVGLLAVALLQLVRWVATGELAKTVGFLALVAILMAYWTVRFAHLASQQTDSLASDAAGLTRTLRRGLGLSIAVFAALAIGPDISDLSQLGALQLSLLVIALAGALGLTAIGPAVERGVPQRLATELARHIDDSGPLSGGSQARITRILEAHPWWTLGAALGAAGAAFMWLVSDGALGHDESVYALKARSWIEGTPATGFGLHRPIGMPVLAWPIIKLGGSEMALRAVGALISLLTVVLVWLLGRRLLSLAAGVVAAVLFATSPSFLRRAPEFLNDNVSTAIVIAIVLLLWRHFEEEDTNRWEVLLVAPLAAIGFYLRYGTVSTLLVVAVVGAFVWRRQLRSSWRQLGAAAGLLLIFVLPHILYAQELTGSITGILSRSTSAAGREYLGEGLVTYASWLPDRLAGPMLGMVVVIGLGSTVVLIVRRQLQQPADKQSRATLLLAGIGLGHLALTGLFVHAEERYVFLSIVLLGLVGSQALLDGVGRLTNPARRVVVAVALVVFVAVSATNLVRARLKVDDLSSDRQVLEETGAAITRATAGGSCIVMTSFLPQVTWYSRCATVQFDLDQPSRLLVAPDPEVDFVVFFDNGKRQPDGALLDAYLDLLDESARVEVPDDDTAIGDATIFPVAEP